MSKVLKWFWINLLFFWLFFGILQVKSAFWSENLNIISRSEWWADESLRYKDSKVWQDYYKKLESEAKKEETKTQKAAREKRETIDNFLTTNYPDDFTASEVIREENWHKLVWPITKTKHVKAIVVHHTDTDSKDSYDAIRSIYKYHTITRKRWDIGYNYLIWLNWEIFEWRAWWDYVVWAHTLWNNYSTVWISIIWKYQDNAINPQQYESLKKLIIFLSKKYWINLSWYHSYHKDCKDCSSYLSNFQSDTIIWHKDAWITSCPWNTLYTQLQWLKTELRNLDLSSEGLKENIPSSSQNIPTNEEKTRLDHKLEAMKEYDLLKLLAIIDYRIDNSRWLNEKLLMQLKIKVLTNIKNKQNSNNSMYTNNSNFDKSQSIKIKLSYPNESKIVVNKSWKDYKIEVKNWKLIFENQIELEKISISSPEWWYLTISSWERKPEWDKENRYNDNKFKWNIILYVKDDKLIVVNEVIFSDYLKWLGEVSDGDNSEKIKTIIIAARTYARWYTSEARKFPWEFYDWSDDSDVFQKYLWYWLELRSPRINKIVDETENQIITYNWKIIKPWYFSQSSGKTMSYLDYCKQNNAKCSSWDYPFLTSVFDPGSVWKTKSGHWVWISWAWATYLASKWWTSEMIVKYYLNWVSLEKM